MDASLGSPFGASPCRVDRMPPVAVSWKPQSQWLVVRSDHFERTARDQILSIVLEAISFFQEPLTLLRCTMESNHLNGDIRHSSKSAYHLPRGQRHHQASRPVCTTGTMV